MKIPTFLVETMIASLADSNFNYTTDGVICFPEASFTYHPAPKNACTSMKSMILDVLGFDGIENQIHVRFGSALFQRKDADIRVCVIRDPVERFVSAYSNRVLHYSQVPHIPFDDLVRNLDMYSGKHAIIYHHFLPQTRYLGADPGYYTHIFNMNEIDQFAALLADLSGKDLCAPRLQTGGNDRKPTPTQKQVECIKEIYKEDYKTFFS